MNALRCRVIFVAVCVLVGFALLSQTFSIPAPRFEPVGGARVPQAAAIALLALCAVALVLGLRVSSRSVPQEDKAGTRDLRGFTFAGIFVAYALALTFRIAGFGWLTAAFLVSLQWLYSGLSKRQLMLSVMLCIAAFLLEYIFTQVFVIDIVRSF